MSITSIDKIKINKYLKETSLKYVCYKGLCNALGKKVKIKDEDFLEYFTDAIILELTKNDKIYSNHLSKLLYFVDGFIGYFKLNEIEIDENVLDKIRSLSELYDEYIKRTNSEFDSNIKEKWLKSIDEHVSELSKNDNSESVAKYIIKIKELEQNTKELKKSLDEITRLYQNLQDSINKENELSDLLVIENEKLKNEVKSKNKDIKELNKTIELLKNKIDDLEKEISNINYENIELSSFKEQYEIIKKELEEQKKQYQLIKDSYDYSDNLEARKKEIGSLIYQKLLLERTNIDDILKYVNQHGFKCDKDEIINVFKALRTTINIDSSIYLNGTNYKVKAPTVFKDRSFNVIVPDDCSYYDIMLVSDFHIREFNSYVLNGFDMLNEYCIKNNINLILNLGDFYDGDGNLEYQDAIRNYDIVEESFKKLPKINGIYHAILGGNHEKNIIKYGFDPLKMLSEEREDFINLGYSHSIIVLKDENNKVICKFDLHHPDCFDFPVSFNKNGLDTSWLNEYLYNTYMRQNRTKSDSYFDAIGHVHKSQFNILESYYFLPPFFESSLKRGACHLRFYFNNDKTVKYALFMPLSVSNQLVKNNEIVYKKML